MNKKIFRVIIVVWTACLIFAGFAIAEEKFAVSADGVRIAYNVEGSGSPVLVFVHGWSCDRGIWEAQVAEFSKSNKTIAVDLAGRGRSGTNRKEWTIQAFGADVASVLEKEAVDKAVLIGHSMGGPVIIEAARLQINRVIGLVAADTMQDLGMMYPADQIDAYLAAFRADFKKTADGFIRGMFPKTADPALVERIAGKMSSADPESAIAALKSLFTYSPAESLKQVRVPIVAVNSDMYPVNVEGNRKLAASFDLKTMKGVGHFVMLEDPATFNRFLAEAIREIVAGKS